MVGCRFLLLDFDPHQKFNVAVTVKMCGPPLGLMFHHVNVKGFKSNHDWAIDFKSCASFDRTASIVGNINVSLLLLEMTL